MSTDNGCSENASALELRDVVVLPSDDEKELDFEVVGLVEDDEKHGYAVCYSETSDTFVVTDQRGSLLEDQGLAQEILDDFLTLAEESADEPSEGGTG